MAQGTGTAATFRGTQLTGHVEDIIFGPSECVVDEAGLFGLTGVNEIVAPVQGRWITLLMHLGPFANAAALDSYITLLEQTLTMNGALVIGSPLSWTFNDCTLRQVLREPGDQQGPKQNQPANQWGEFCRLVFRRLS
jgi:hypothetical protein